MAPWNILPDCEVHKTHVWIDQSRISPLQIIKDDNLFEKFHTVIDETGPTPFTIIFLLVY